MQKKLFGMIAAAALAGSLASSALAAGGEKACYKDEKNKCKGQGTCGGKAQGKAHECGGKNECKNNWKKDAAATSEADCKKANGKWM